MVVILAAVQFQATSSTPRISILANVRHAFIICNFRVQNAFIEVDKTCRNLTVDDAPENGGLVCYWYTDENSQYCSIKCNHGFEFPSGINRYETCGPTTNYSWFYEKRNIGIPNCIGMKAAISMFYPLLFSSHCRGNVSWCEAGGWRPLFC